MSPQFMQRGLLHLAKRMRTEVFGLPDAFEDVHRLCQLVKPVALLDIGAHEGETVKEFARLDPGVKIHAFEPTPSTAEILRNRTGHLRQVNVHETVIGDKVGRVTFHLNKNSQTNSLLENDWGNRELVGTATEHVEKVEVAATTLDEWARTNEPTGELVIKADVQGAEAQVVSGGRNTFQRVAVFYTEVSLAPLYAGQTDFFQLHQILSRELPFTLFQVYRTRSSSYGRALWTDVLYVRNDLLERFRQ